MKIVKSLTCLFAVLLVSACNGHSSATFSSFLENTSSSAEISSMSSSQPVSYSETSSSSSETSSSEASSSSSEASSSSQTSSSNQHQTSYYYGYYDSLVSWTDGEDLKNQLHAIIRNGYQPLSYTKSGKQNYDTNIHADHSKYDFEMLDVIYSKNNTFKTETNKGWQREHAWCASLMCGSSTGNAVAYKGRATDYHNLFAANASGNQSRGNKNYGYADPLAVSYDTRNMVDNGNDGYSFDEFIFEPGDIDKGRLARAIFYMATMYKDDEYDSANGITMKGLQIVEEPVSYVAGNNCAFAIGNLTDLLEWNEDVPVDYLEMHHNLSVYTDIANPDGVAQGNRNPYVDYPGLVDYVYGSKKNQPGTLKDVVASASYLNSEEHTLSHYAIKEAKREYGFGETLKPSDYKVMSVFNDYTCVIADEDILNSYDNYTFKESDGDEVTAVIATMINVISYKIVLNPMGVCNSGILGFTTEGINKKTPDVNQQITIDGVPLYFNFSTTFSDVTTTGMTITNNNADGGGITIGSSNRVLTKLIITTKNSYTFDAVYAKAKAGNASSNYSLTIKVGDTVVASGSITDSKNMKVFGNKSETPYTGQISFIFTGSSCLKLNSIAFNSIIA